MPPTNSANPAGAPIYIFTYTCTRNLLKRVPKPGVIGQVNSREEAIARAKEFREEALAMYRDTEENPADVRWGLEGGNDKRLGEEGWSCEATTREKEKMVCGVWKWVVS